MAEQDQNTTNETTGVRFSGGPSTDLSTTDFPPGTTSVENGVPSNIKGQVLTGGPQKPKPAFDPNMLIPPPVAQAAPPVPQKPKFDPNMMIPPSPAMVDHQEAWKQAGPAAQKPLNEKETFKIHVPGITPGGVGFGTIDTGLHFDPFSASDWKKAIFGDTDVNVRGDKVVVDTTKAPTTLGGAVAQQTQRQTEAAEDIKHGHVIRGVGKLVNEAAAPGVSYTGLAKTVGGMAVDTAAKVGKTVDALKDYAKDHGVYDIVHGDVSKGLTELGTTFLDHHPELVDFAVGTAKGIHAIENGDIADGAKQIVGARLGLLRGSVLPESPLEKQIQAYNPTFKGTAPDGQRLIDPTTIRGTALPPADISQFVDVKEHPIEKATLENAQGFLSPESIALIVGGGGTALLKDARAINTMNRVVAAGFSAQAIAGAIQHSQAAYDAIQAGDAPLAIYHIAHASESGAMAVPGIYGAAGEHMAVVSPEDIAAVNKLKEVGTKAAGRVTDAAASAARDLITTVKKTVTLGAAQTVPEAIRRIAEPSKGVAAEYIKKLNRSENDLTAILNTNKKAAESPQGLVDALQEHIDGIADELLRRSKATMDETAPVVPDIEQRVRKAMTDYAKEHRGELGSDAEVEAAMQQIMEQVLRTEGEGETQTSRPVNLHEAEGLRRKLNKDGQAQFAPGAKPTTDAYKVLSQHVAEEVLRPAIDERFTAEGVDNVKEARERMADLIDIKKQVIKGQGVFEKMGAPGVMSTIMKKLGTPGFIVALMTGVAFPHYGVPGLVAAVLGDRIAQNLTHPLVNLERAQKIAARSPNAKAVTIDTSRAEGGVPPTGEPPAGGPTPGVPPAEPPANPNKPAPVPPTPPVRPAPEPAPVNHALHEALASYYDMPLESTAPEASLEALKARFYKNGVDIAEGRITPTPEQAAARKEMLKIVNKAVREERVYHDEQQQKANEKFSEDVKKYNEDFELYIQELQKYSDEQLKAKQEAEAKEQEKTVAAAPKAEVAESKSKGEETASGFKYYKPTGTTMGGGISEQAGEIIVTNHELPGGGEDYHQWVMTPEERAEYEAIQKLPRREQTTAEDELAKKIVEGRQPDRLRRWTPNPNVAKEPLNPGEYVTEPFKPKGVLKGGISAKGFEESIPKAMAEQQAQALRVETEDLKEKMRAGKGTPEEQAAAEKRIAENEERIAELTKAPVLQTGGEELEMPRSYGRWGMTWQRLRAHELGHAIVQHLLGNKPIEVQSHTHPELRAEDSRALASANWNKDKFMTDGHLDRDKMADNVSELLTQAWAGPLAEEIMHGVDHMTSKSGEGDRSVVNRLLREFVDPSHREFMSDQAKDAARKMLTTPEARAILEKYSKERLSDVADTHHFEEKHLDEIMREHDNERAKRTGGREGGEPGIPREAKAIGARGEEKAPVARGPQEAGDERLRNPVSEEPEDRLVAGELQTALKQPFEATVVDAEGQQHTETVKGYSFNDAMKAAKKAFPGARAIDLSRGAETAPAEGYKVPTGKHLSMPPSEDRTPAMTMRHELGHAMVGQNEGMTPQGMLRTTHPFVSKDTRAAISWDTDGVIDKYTGRINPDKMPAVISSLMGGIAADEVFNNVPRDKNINFTWMDHPHSDSGQALRFLKQLGYSREDGISMLHQMVDKAKEYLTNPHVRAIVEENADVREKELSRQYHFSGERLRSMANEAQRRINNEKGINNQGVGREGDRGREEAVAGREGEGAPAAGQKLQTAEVNQEHEHLLDRWLKEKSNYHPDLQGVIAQTRSLSREPSDIKRGASFIAPDGQYTYLRPGTQHPQLISAANPERVGGAVDNRPDFLNDTGAVRTRYTEGRGGPTLAVSVPEQGVTPAQLESIRKAVGHVGRTGNLILETAGGKGNPPRSEMKEFATPTDVEPMLRKIGAHPEGLLKNEMTAEPMAGYARSHEAEREETAKTAEQLKAHEANGGSTFTPEGENLAGKDLYAVGAYPKRTLEVDKLTPEVLAAFKAKNADVLSQGDHAVGTWKDPDTGKAVLDITKLYKDRDEAIAAGKAANQKAIYHLGTNETIDTGGTGEVLPEKPAPTEPTPNRKAALRAEVNQAPEEEKTPFPTRQDYRGYTVPDWEKLTTPEQIIAAVKDSAYATYTPDEIKAGRPWLSENDKKAGKMAKLSPNRANESGFIHPDGSMSMVGDSFLHDVFEKEAGLNDTDIVKKAGIGTYDIWQAPHGDNVGLSFNLPARPTDGQIQTIAALTKHMRAAEADKMTSVTVEWPGGSKEIEFPTPGKVVRELRNEINQSPEEESFAFGHNVEGTPDQQKGLISTRVPTATKATENPLTEDLQIGREAIHSVPGLAEKMADLVREYPGVNIPKNIKDPEKVLDRFTNHVKENLKTLYNQVSPERREANMKWYDSANALASKLADKYGKTTKQIAGVIAAMSPQKDWDMNVGLAERVNDIYHQHQNTVATPAMISKGAEIGSRPTGKVFAELTPKLEGKRLSDLTDPLEKAAFIRLYDEAHNPRTYQSIDPATGEGRGTVKTDTGEPRRIAWGSLNEIAKAISILEDGSRENISNNLGDAHKVRNFYNNILDPNNPAGHVTIDTHAVAAGLMRMLSGKSSEVLHNFGSGGGPKSAINGVNGTYALYADAYRQAAAELGVQPRQLQSVVWEEIRNMFPSEMKRVPKHVEAVNDIWKQYGDRKISLDKAHELVRQYAQEASKEMAEKQKPGKISANDLLEALGQGGLFALSGGKK